MMGMGAASWIKKHGELTWFLVLLVLVGIFATWSLEEVVSGTSTNYRFGLPLASGVPRPLPNGTLVVNITAYQWGYTPDVIVAKPGQPVLVVLHSRDVVHGFLLKLPSGTVNVDIVPGTLSYVFFYAPNTPGNYTWRCSEYCGIGHSFMNGTVEVI
jgi:heme/copper-type cytochrome/quinol oxidase subunit 2